jgi:hypothetical protein
MHSDNPTPYSGSSIPVGWVERSETHLLVVTMGFAMLNPSYGYYYGY